MMDYREAQMKYLETVITPEMYDSVLADDYISEALKRSEAIIKDDLVKEAYQKVFDGSAAAEIVLNDLITYGGLLALSFTGNSQTFFNEGKRAMLLRILFAVFSKYETFED
jgi:hypothetical protein